MDADHPENGGLIARLSTPSGDDDAVLLGFLGRTGPATYGAAADSLGWGVTRTMQAKARLRGARLIRYGEHGRAVLVETEEAAGSSTNGQPRRPRSAGGRSIASG